jgi:pyruvate,orthophosphate dikinase
MVPLVVLREELELVREWVLDEVASVASERGVELHVGVGTMIETPRAALCAGDIASVADFFSFGTNDLTQMTFGFSRDDVESRVLRPYLDAGILRQSPFETVDVEGVGELVRVAVDRGRAARPSLGLGVCGEHGGDPASIGFFHRCGVDYVSCSPMRVPVARLAAAQAVLSAVGPEPDPTA